jgi:peptidoglycan/LPS O-acetylase OafA/YrhL
MSSEIDLAGRGTRIDIATPSRPTPQFWTVLAGLRFFFAMWVLFDHTYNFGPAERAMPIFTKSGLMAVICFFAISGFSIHHSIADRREGYLRRRFWRIVPVNTLAVAIGWIAWSVLGLRGGYGTPSHALHVLDFVGYLLLLESFLPIFVDFLFPAWSLSIEAAYYLVAPALLRASGRRVLTLIFLSMLLFIAWPHIRNLYIANAPYGIAVLGMAWAWLAGWYAYSHPRDRVTMASLVAGGLIGIYAQALFFDARSVMSVVGNAAAWIGMLWVLFYRFGSIRSPALIYLGEISYPLYLLHYPVLFALTSSVLKTHPEWNYGIVQVAAALITAIVAYHFVERPLRRFGLPRSTGRSPATRMPPLAGIQTVRSADLAS